MRYANFCTKCGAKASGRFCVKCGSEIYVMDDSTDNNNASEKEKYVISTDPALARKEREERAARLAALKKLQSEQDNKDEEGKQE